MFLVIPAVDIQKGRAVRLFEGDPQRETVYFDRPLDAAEHWARLGAEWIHLVDLDAALDSGDNRSEILGIADTKIAHFEVGGGIRSFEAARGWLERVERVVLGTIAAQQPEIVQALVEKFGPHRIAVSIDARKGKVAVRGWAEITEVSATDLAMSMAGLGVRQLIYTDVSRDGTMLGVDPEPVQEIRSAFPHTLIAGGGVATDADIDLYEALGLDGCIVGRALYEGRIRYPRTP
jgi:phosphoribosylformimino-5-aminoimidazole carboxamide ribotide isomerase